MEFTFLDFSDSSGSFLSKKYMQIDQLTRTTYSQTDDVFSRLGFLFRQDAGHLKVLAQIKRFLECYTGDHQFRVKLLSGIMTLEDAAKLSGCDLDLSSLRPIFHPAFTQFRADATLADWPLAFMWNLYIREMIELRDALVSVGGTGGVNKNFDSWRMRNMSRTSFELGPSASGIVHPSVAFELSSGCSVGCWFCGISAKKFAGHFSLSGNGRNEWSEILEATKAVLGSGIKTGFCYWATDPLDNSDYPDFLKIFQEIVGVLPQTTTAIPLRNIELTRRVLELWKSNPGLPNRFSVLSTSTLHKIHEVFTAEELLGVEMVLQNKKANGVVKFRAGRSGKKINITDVKNTDLRIDSKQADERLIDGTIACVTGFLINIVEKTVRLVSPTMPSEKWPDGYIVYDSALYETPADLRQVLERMVKSHMPETLIADEPVRFIDQLELKQGSTERSGLASKWITIESSDFKRFGKLVQSGNLTPMEIFDRLCDEGEHPVSVVGLMENVWNSGLLIQ